MSLAITKDDLRSAIAELDSSLLQDCPDDFVELLILAVSSPADAVISDDEPAGQPFDLRQLLQDLANVAQLVGLAYTILAFHRSIGRPAPTDEELTKALKPDDEDSERVSKAIAAARKAVDQRFDQK